MKTKPKPLPPLAGYKYLERVTPLLERLRDSGCDRDKANNRELHFDRYAALLLLYFFNPVLTSLRGIQQATELDKVAHATGGGRVSLGSLSEAVRVFDPALLREVLGELAAKALPHGPPADRAALADLVAVDGSLIGTLPTLTRACAKGGKLHLAFEVFRGPLDATITHPQASERAELRRALLRAGKIYVMDRGYESYELLADIRKAGSSFVVRLQADVAFEVAEERPVSCEAQAQGVTRDGVLSRLGGSHHKDWHKGESLRVVTAQAPAVRGGPVSSVTLVTDKLDWPAELVAVAYRYRWSVELFFRWLKSILGCRHLLSHSPDGVAVQVYVALIASVLLGSWSGLKPSKRTFEMVCHYFNGWATEAELSHYLRKALAKAESSA